MPLVPIPFAEHSYKDRSTPLSSQRLLNLYLEPKPEGSKNRVALHGTPGLKPWITVGSGPCRGMLRMGIYLYVVSGTEVYRVSAGGVTTKLGDVTGVQPVSMAGDGTNLVIVSDSDIYGATSSTLAILPITNCRGVAFHDGYLMLAEKNTQAMFINDILSLPSLVFDPLDFTLVNTYPDNNMGIVNVNRETIVFGERSAQKYYNSGNADFPFDRTPSGVVERGTVAPRSIVGYQGITAWLGDDLSVYTLNGDQPVKISTPPIDLLIKGASAHDAAQGFAYAQDNHLFYVLTFPGYLTVVFDATTGRWHERQSFQREDWLVRGHEYFAKEHIVGSAIDGKLFTLDLDTYTDDDGIVQRQMTAPVIAAQGERIVMHRLQVDCETGIGIDSGQGSDPQLMLDWSDDGGRTWSNEHWRSAGSGGDYGKRVIWARLGMFRQRTLRITMSDPVKAAWFEAYAQMTGARG